MSEETVTKFAQTLAKLLERPEAWAYIAGTEPAIERRVRTGNDPTGYMLQLSFDDELMLATVIIKGPGYMHIWHRFSSEDSFLLGKRLQVCIRDAKKKHLDNKKKVTIAAFDKLQPLLENLI